MAGIQNWKSLLIYRQRGIPSLDGLRALSIALVVGGHLGYSALHLRFFTDIAVFGVRVFFVISGYLITSLLLKELSRSRTISLRLFYARRAMRLFPAAYVFVGAVAIAWPNLLHPRDIAWALTYTMNYAFGRSDMLGHLWSLAVEEQFYLLWPAVLLWAGAARAKNVLIGVMIATPFLRLASPYIGAASGFVIYADALGAGCLLAVSPRSLPGRLFARWGLLIALAAHFIPSTKVNFLIGQSIENVMIALFIQWAINDRGAASRILNWRPIAAIGILSYSIYLWQQPFVFVRVVKNPIAALACTFLLAAASYWLVEKPGLALRDWLIGRGPAATGAKTAPDVLLAK